MRTFTFAVLFFAFWWMIAEWVRRLDGPLGFSLPKPAALIGALVMVLGAAISLPCVALFVLQGHGTPAPFDPPREFVATGPYRWCRNPMYVGLLLLLGGLALRWRSAAVLILAALMAVAVHFLVIAYEEPQLRTQFGDSYRSYCRQVPRWIPKLHSRAPEPTRI